MAQASIPLDTDPAIFEMVVDRWRTMTIAERVELVDRMCADVELLAVTGILAQRPDRSEVEVRHELARRRYGERLADEAYAHLMA
ncbi:MAG: hypothetical protein JWM47_1228 [Acidimicrobiales bacterium]|nr:hypothetical protein [Acidimicrobiales bacterium]